MRQVVQLLTGMAQGQRETNLIMTQMRETAALVNMVCPNSSPRQRRAAGPPRPPPPTRHQVRPSQGLPSSHGRVTSQRLKISPKSARKNLN